jgi:ORF6N domain
MLSRDLAILYGVAVNVLNQAVKRNAVRFPADFVFQLKAEELANLKSQFVTQVGVARDERVLTHLLSKARLCYQAFWKASAR